MKSMMCAEKVSGLQLGPFSELGVTELSMVVLALGGSSCLTLHDFPGPAHLLP